MRTRIYAMKRQSLLLTVALYCVTGGVYAVYWFYKAGKELYGSNPGPKRHLPMVMVASAVGIIVFAFLVVGLGVESLGGAISWFALFAFVCVLLVYGLAFVIAKDLAKVIRRDDEKVCSSALAGVLTFLGFFSAIYLQSCLNAQGQDRHAA